MKILMTLVISLALLFLTIFFAGGGHGTYTPAKIIYPYTMILANFKNEIGVFGMILAIAQVPLYAYLLFQKSHLKYYILGTHFIAVIFAMMTTFAPS